MALTQLGSPYPVFTDLDGTPLDAGFVYIGVADDNPETAPILVYYDQELTQIAPQPLRTVNGYVMRNGAPAILYANATFSVTVRNRNGALVLYAPQSFGTVPGGGLRSQNNLSDVDSAPASLVNLGLTATAAELNILDGVTATTAELNFVDGVTSNIQTQLDAKPVLGGTAAISTASGSTKTQAIPAGVQEVIVVLDEVGVDTAQGILELQLGTSAALVTTGYESACLEGNATPVLRTSTSSISLGRPITAFASGTVTLTRAVAGGNHWDASFSGRFGTAQVLSGSGSITLAGELDLIGLVSTNFDNGQFYVRWR